MLDSSELPRFEIAKHAKGDVDPTPKTARITAVAVGADPTGSVDKPAGEAVPRVGNLASSVGEMDLPHWSRQAPSDQLKEEPDGWSDEFRIK